MNRPIFARQIPLTTGVVVAVLASLFWVPTADAQRGRSFGGARPGIAGPGRMSIGSTWSRSQLPGQGVSTPSGPVGRQFGGHHGGGHHHHVHHHGGVGAPYVPYVPFGYGYGYGSYPGFSFYSPWVDVTIDSARYGRVYSGPAGFPTTVYGNPYRGSATYSVVPYTGITVPPVVNGYNLSAPSLPLGAIPIDQHVPAQQNFTIDENVPLDQNPNQNPELIIPQEFEPPPAVNGDVQVAKPDADTVDGRGDDSITNDTLIDNVRDAAASFDDAPVVDEFAVPPIDIQASTAAQRLQGLRLQSRGDREFRAGNFAAAMKHYEAAADAAADRRAPWIRQVWCLVAQDDFAGAAQTLKQALQVSDNSELAWVEAADLFGSEQAADRMTNERLWEWLDRRPGSADRILLAAAFEFFRGVPDTGNELLSLAEDGGLDRDIANALRNAVTNVRPDDIDGVPVPVE